MKYFIEEQDYDGWRLCFGIKNEKFTVVGKIVDRALAELIVILLNEKLK